MAKGKEKQPCYIHRQDGAPLALAGLWERWQGQIESCSIITTNANTLVGQLHNRMPVILEPDQFSQWLDNGEERPETLSPLLHPPEENVLAMHPVSIYVRKPGNVGERCIEPIKRDA